MGVSLVRTCPKNMRVGLVRLAFLMRVENFVLFCISTNSQSSPFFFLILIMIKCLMFNKLRNLNNFTNLSKDFGKLDDKLIIQYFHYIHIRI